MPTLTVVADARLGQAHNNVALHVIGQHELVAHRTFDAWKQDRKRPSEAHRRGVGEDSEITRRWNSMLIVGYLSHRKRCLMNPVSRGTSRTGEEEVG